MEGEQYFFLTEHVVYDASRQAEERRKTEPNQRARYKFKELPEALHCYFKNYRLCDLGGLCEAFRYKEP